MKRNVILTALAALALASCAKVENAVPVPQAKPVSMDFGVYVPQTKAGAAGAMDDAKLRSTGFGVMAYVEAGGYTGSASANFMYNQQVTYSGSGWTYSPVKYWPNQLDDTGIGGDGQPARTVSFFAYAPYVETAGGTEGITALYDGTGDPTLTYRISEDLNKHVDLIWGTSDGTTWSNAAGGGNPVAEGLPYLNLQKPVAGTKVAFRFLHALSQLNLSVVGAYNVIPAGGNPADGVKVTVGEVVLSIPGQYEEAVLNLNNTDPKKPRWQLPVPPATKDLSLTLSGDRLHPDILDAGAVGVLGQPAGVGAAEKPLLAENKYFTFIPKEDPVTITLKITYYVTTDDPNLEGGFCRVENVISKNLTLPHGFRAGTRNNIRLILGLSEVSLSAEVSDWETGQTVGTYLPKNE